MLEKIDNAKSTILIVVMVLLSVVGALVLRADNQQLETLKDHEQRLKAVERISEKNAIILPRIEKKIDKLLDE